MDWNQGYYRAVPFRSFGIDRHHALLAVSSQEGVVPVVGAVPFMLSTCAVPRTLAEHEQAVMARASEAEHSFVHATIESMVKAGLLRLEADVDETLGPEARAITTVAITTAERPQRLQRCLESLLSHLDERGAGVRVLVVDGSVSPDASVGGRALVAEAARRHSCAVDYLGQAERHQLEQRLVDAGANPRIVRYAVAGGMEAPAKGAMRNVAQLATAGECVLMLDDDMVCTVWSPQERTTRGLRLCGHSDPRSHRFFETRDDAMPDGLIAEAGLLDAHERLVGWRLSDLVARAGGSYDTTTACAHLLFMSAGAQSRARVRVSMTGVAGDSGLDCPYRLLLREGRWKADLETSRELFDRALTFCEVRRIADIESVTHDPACELMCTAIDNVDPMPPFLPVGRDDGRLFGTLLGMCDPEALFAHVPVGMAYDSDRSWQEWTGSIVSASSLRLADVLLAVLSRSHVPSWCSGIPGRMRRIADNVGALAALPDDEFRESVQTLVVEQRSQELMKIDGVLQDAASSCPPYWKAALGRYRTAVLDALEHPRFYRPVDIGQHDLPDAPDACQTAVGRFSELLREWPEIRTVAARCAASPAAQPEPS